MAVIYQIKNQINDKSYVGMTNRSVDVRWKEHQKFARLGAKQYFSCAIRKHTPSVFRVIVIEEGLDQKFAKDVREPYWISVIKPEYNLTKGGEGVIGWLPTPEQREKMKRSHVGIPLSPQHRQSLRVSKSFKGRKPCSDENKHNISLGLQNSKKFKESMKVLGIKRRGISRPLEIGRKVSTSKMGHSVSLETRKRISESLKGRAGMKHSIIACPHCPKTGGNNTMTRWHFDNCKERGVQ